MLDPIRVLAAITVIAMLIALGVWCCCTDEDQGDLW